MDNVGFAVLCRAGAVEFQVFGARESACSQLVSYAENSDTQAVVMGRFYYQREWGDRLRGIDLDQLDEAQLALAIYNELGADGLKQLEGDFAVALFDRRTQKLFASRDVLGGYPIYWLQAKDTVAVASVLRPLVDRLPDRRLNIGHLGEVQLTRFGQNDFLDTTPFVGIQRLIPGYHLVAHLNSLTVRTYRFWDWPQSIVDPGSVPVEELAEQYAFLLKSAVRERLRGTVVSHFSGGMDSTSVALLARTELHKQGRPLHALSLIYEKLNNLKRETTYIEEALGPSDLISHRIVADELLDYDGFENAPLHDEPYSGLFRIGMFGALTRAAAKLGANTILSGLGADEVLADAPYYLADLLRCGRLYQAWSQALVWSQARQTSLWRYLGNYGVAPLLPAAWRIGSKDPWSIPLWVRPEFIRQTKLKEALRERMRSEFNQDRSIVRSEALARIRFFATGDWCRYNLSAPHGIVAAHPFRDRRVLLFALGARTQIRPRPDLQKHLLNEATRGILPEKIRQRRGKEHFNAVYYLGLSRNLPCLESLVQHAGSDSLELFDKTRLLKSLRAFSMGVGTLDATAGLNSTLAILKWLSQLPAWLSQPCVPKALDFQSTRIRP